MSHTRKHYPLRLDESLREQVRSQATVNGQTMHEFIEEAIRIHIMTDIAARNDGEIAPLIAKYIHDSQKQHAGTLRKLIARIGLEVFRFEHVMFLFMRHAGVDWDQLTGWREEGWKHAVKEIKNLPFSDGIDE